MYSAIQQACFLNVSHWQTDAYSIISCIYDTMLNGDLVLDTGVLTNTTLCSVDHVKRKISK